VTRIYTLLERLDNISNVLIAGLIGSVVYILTQRRTRPYDALTAMITGLACSGYLTHPIIEGVFRWIEWRIPEAPMGFVVGLVGVAICSSALMIIRKRGEALAGSGSITAEVEIKAPKAPGETAEVKTVVKVEPAVEAAKEDK
jgi:hypothetical protein